MMVMIWEVTFQDNVHIGEPDHVYDRLRVVAKTVEDAAEKARKKFKGEDVCVVRVSLLAAAESKR